MVEFGNEDRAMDILIVEDDENIANAASEILHFKGYQSYICSSGTLAVDLIKRNDYDLILLDIMLPGLDGFQVMERTTYRKIPVIFITAKEGIKDKLRGFHLGAEDYLVKPFEMMELLARVDVVLRRSKKISTDGEYTYQGIRININTHNIQKDGVDLVLRPREFELAAYFMANQGIVLTREVLMDVVWGNEFGGETRTLDNHVRQIRKKLGWEKCLITVTKIGYKLIRMD